MDVSLLEGGINEGVVTLEESVEEDLAIPAVASISDLLNVVKLLIVINGCDRGLALGVRSQ